MIITDSNVTSKQEIRDGLRRLAFGSITDSVRLLLKGEELSPRQLKGLDLYNVACIKRGTGGVTEIKFFDRLKALEQLSGFESSAGTSQSALLEALKNSVSETGGKD